LADFVDVFTRLPDFTHIAFTVANWPTAPYGDYVLNTRIMGSNLARGMLIVDDFLYCALFRYRPFALFRYRPCAGPIIRLIYLIGCLTIHGRKINFEFGTEVEEQE
jgi:hypothetical protein